jgi:monoamine oxidase
MARSPALRALERLMLVHAAADPHKRVGAGMSRADFTRLVLAGAAGVALVPAFKYGMSWARGRERVAIVGAGIAGLTCALTLRDAGISSEIFESSDRIGGRMHSERRYWQGGQHTEWCGSMIDSQHLTMLGLARRFKLPIVDSLAPLKAGARDTSFIDDHYYLMSEADRDFAPVYRILQHQVALTGDNVSHDNASPLARQLDAISMLQWVEKYVPGGRNSRFGKLILIALANEQGVAAEQQSALNLVQMLGIQYHYTDRGGKMNVLGYSDQRYNIGGGNQRLPEAIAASLPAGTIRLRQRLTAIRRLPGGTYELRFSTPSGDVRETFDRVVLALPFVTLRGVDYASAGFNARKKKVIEELGYGIHTKLQMQFNSRPWTQKGAWPYPTTGQIWTDTGFQNSVDFSLGQAGNYGIIERFTGMTPAILDTPPTPYAQIHDSPAVKRHVEEFFGELNKIWPGVSKHWNGKATFGNVQADPNILNSYSCWLVGQVTTIAGYEKVRQGNVHFAGEHTSVEHQGFMEGGASSGIAAAREVLADYKVTTKSA